MRTRGQNAPKNSIWGTIQTIDKIAKGVYIVGTASHGGIMVDIYHLMNYCTPAQVRHGAQFDELQNWVHFEEDNDICVFMDTNRALFKGLNIDELERDLQTYYPQYLIDKVGSNWESLINNN